MNEVSIIRLYVLRAMYLVIAIGLGLTIWPGILSPPEDLSHMAGVVRAVLGGVSLLALAGVRYPVRMLPLLYFELTWKLIWVLAFGLPLWLNGRLVGGLADTMFDCLLGVVILPVVLPWGYTYRHYIKAPSDRWGGGDIKP